MQKKLISVVVPVYNEEVYLEVFFKKLKKACAPNGFEYIFVNDGSTDFSTQILQDIADKDAAVKIVTLNQNYGKQIAITAGMKYASGNAVIVCSVKNGEPYRAIEELVDKHFIGGEIVRGYFAKKFGFFGRNWAKFKAFLLRSSLVFFGVRNRLIMKPDIELYDRKVVDIINELPEKNMFLRRTQSLFGFKETDVVFDAHKSSKEEQAKYQKKRAELDKKRKDENIKEPQKRKKRLYATSLWISYGMFVLSGLLLICFLIISTIRADVLFIAINLVFLFSSLFVSALFLARANIIRTLGILFFLRRGESLFEVKSLTNF